MTTQKEIANKTGTSQSTVSRVHLKEDGVAPKTRAKVQKEISRTNYKHPHKGK